MCIVFRLNLEYSRKNEKTQKCPRSLKTTVSFVRAGYIPQEKWLLRLCVSSSCYYRAWPQARKWRFIKNEQYFRLKRSCGAHWEYNHKLLFCPLIFLKRARSGSFSGFTPGIGKLLHWGPHWTHSAPRIDAGRGWKWSSVDTRCHWVSQWFDSSQSRSMMTNLLNLLLLKKWPSFRDFCVCDLQVWLTEIRRRRKIER